MILYKNNNLNMLLKIILYNNCIQIYIDKNLYKNCVYLTKISFNSNKNKLIQQMIYIID